jgi:hypothetical protein
LIWINLHLYGVGNSDGRRQRRATSAGSLWTFVVNLAANIGAIIIQQTTVSAEEEIQL